MSDQLLKKLENQLNSESYLDLKNYAKGKKMATRDDRDIFALFMVVIVIMFMACLAKADSMCEESSLKGNVYTICAHGDGNNEMLARHNLTYAFDMEFDSYCDKSTECKKAEKKIIPKRTVCVSNPKGDYNDKWKCVQMTDVVLN